MKILFYLLLITGSLGLGWAVYPNIKQSMDASLKERLTAEGTAVNGIPSRSQAASPAETESLSGAGQLLASLGKPTPTTPAATPSTSDVPSSQEPVFTTKVEGSPKTAVGPPPSVDPLELKYPLPKLRTIEEITKEWSTIPSSAFPRKVKTKVPVNFDTGSRKLTIPVNATALAVGMAQGMLILMPEGDKSARQMVPIGNTNLKEMMIDLYEKFKTHKTSLVMQQRERARTLIARGADASEIEKKHAGPKPMQNPDRVIPIMLAHLKASKFTELKEESIVSWGELAIEEIGGGIYWTCALQCTVENAFFGTTPSEVIALMKDGKVIKWLFTGSKQEVK